jgi:hypothetical protein
MLRRARDVRRVDIDWRAASWIWPWLIGLTIIGLIGRYGTGSQQLLPEWVDLLVVVGFSLVIFYYAVSLAMSGETISRIVAAEQRQEEIALAGVD